MFIPIFASFLPIHFSVASAWVRQTLPVHTALSKPPSPAGDAAKTESAYLSDLATLKPFSFVKRNAYMGEILEALSEQTGLDLYASDSDGAAGLRLTILVKNESARSVMHALAAEYSHKGAKLYWQTEERAENGGTHRRYRLMRPTTAVELHDTLKKQFRAEFEAHALEAIKALDWTPEQRKANIKYNPDVECLDFPRYMKEVKAFLATLNESEQRRVLRGEQITRSLSDAPAAAQEYAHSETELKRSDNPGWTFPEPELIQFEGRDDMFPSVSVLIGNSTGVEGGGLFGGSGWSDDKVREIRDSWLDGAAKDDSALMQKVLPPLSEEQEKKNADRRPPIKYMYGMPLVSVSDPSAASNTDPYFVAAQEFFERTGRGVLYITAHADLTVVKPPPLNTYADVVKQLDSSDEEGHQWIGNILLIGSHWYVSDADWTPLPWDLVKILRAGRAASHDDFPGLDSVAQSAYWMNKHGLTEKQAQAILSEFPEFALVESAANLYALARTNPSLWRRIAASNGVSFAALPEFVRDAVSLHVPADKCDGTRLRFVDGKRMVTIDPKYHVPSGNTFVTYQRGLFLEKDDGSLVAQFGQAKMISRPARLQASR